MNKKMVILFILFIFLMLYFIKDPVISLLFKNDFNLEDRYVIMKRIILI